MNRHARRICFAVIFALCAAARALAQAPANDSFSSPVTLSGTTASVTGSSSGASRQNGEPVHANVGGGASVWWQWTAPQGGLVTINTVGSSFDTVLAVYTGTAVNALSQIAANDDLSNDSVASSVSFTATSGVTYRIAVDGYNGPNGVEAGSIRLNLAYSGVGAPGNDAFASASALSGAAATVTGSTVGSTRENGEPTHAGVGGGISSWWVWTAPQSGSVTLSTAGSSFDTVLAVYSGNSVSALTQIAANDDDETAGVLTSVATFTAVSGTTYRIAVDGYNGAAGSVRLTLALVAASGTAPTISQQPASQSVSVGASAQFSVSATGTAPLAYQWRLNGANIPGGTAATLVLPSVVAGSAGSYSVVVSNAFGSVTSSNATLTVGATNAPPAITSQPQPVSVGAGGTATFSVTVSSATAVSYQWRFNGANISGATGATLTINNVGNANAGAYSVVVTNSGGSATSINATLSVVTVTPPTITGQPVSQTVTAGSSVSFAVVASSSVAVSYQWRFNGGNIAGATSSTLSLTNVQAGQAGTYSVVVSNSAGATASANATLAVTAVVQPPSIVTSPSSQNVNSGAAVTLGVNAAGSGLSYQWFSYGNAIPGATGATYTIPNFDPANAGFYAVRVSNSAGSAMSSYATVTQNATGTRIINVSTRGAVPPGGNLTPGIVLRGSGSKTLLVRGIGPVLGQFGVSGTLPDPQFQVIPQGVPRPIWVNTDWETGNDVNRLRDTMAALGAFALSAGARDAAALVPLASGNYSVVISGKNASDTGVVLGEIYDPDPLSSPVRLVNVSTTAFAGAGDQVLIPGFAIGGSGSKQLLIRAVGPSLSQFGVPNRLNDPRLEVVPQGQNFVIASNDNWGGSAALQAAFSQVGAFNFTSGVSLDAAVVVRVPPGVYTVVVRGAGNTTGTATVEIYDLDP